MRLTSLLSDLSSWTLNHRVDWLVKGRCLIDAEGIQGAVLNTSLVHGAGLVNMGRMLTVDKKVRTHMSMQTPELEPASQAEDVCAWIASV